MMKKILPFLLMIMILTGCSNGSSELESGTGELVERKSGGVLKMACVPVDTLNPLVTSHASIADVLSLVYEGLFVTLPDLTVRPVLATEYIASENNTVYTVKLKDSAEFHDGKRFTAADVVATLGYISLYGGTYADVVSDIEAYWADGNDTVVIRLKKSISDFMNKFDFPILPDGLGDDSFLKDNDGFVPVGTGPYKYSGTLEHKNIYLDANKKWHKEESPYIEKIDVAVLSDEETIISAFDVGSIDVVSTSWKNLADMNLTSSMYSVFECEQNRFTFIGINCNSENFDTADERILLAESVDSKALTEDIMIGNAVAASSPVRDGVYFNEETGTESNRTQASGRYENDDETKKCTILYNSESKTKSRLASAVKHQLETNGYEVTLDEQSYESYTEKILLDKYDLYIGEVKIDNSGNLAFMFGSERSPGRLCNYFDTEFENLTANLDLMSGKEDKSIAWNNFENYYTQKAVQIPLYFTNGAVLINKRISGTPEPNLSKLYYGFEQLYIENEK